MSNYYSGNQDSVDNSTNNLNIERTYIVTTNNGKYYLDNLENPNITLKINKTYIFDLSDSSTNGHPFYITTGNPGGQNAIDNKYDNGVITNGNHNGTTTKTVIFTVPENSPNILYYHCGIHQNMGNTINLVDTSTDNTSTDNTSTNNTSTNNTSTNNTSTDNTSTDNTSTDNTSTNNTSTDNTSTDNTSTDNTSTNNTSTDNTSTDNTSTDNTSTDNTSTDNTSTDNTSTDNTLADDIILHNYNLNNNLNKTLIVTVKNNYPNKLINFKKFKLEHKNILESIIELSNLSDSEIKTIKQECLYFFDSIELKVNNIKSISTLKNTETKIKLNKNIDTIIVKGEISSILFNEGIILTDFLEEKLNSVINNESNNTHNDKIDLIKKSINELRKEHLIKYLLYSGYNVILEPGNYIDDNNDLANQGFILATYIDYQYDNLNSEDLPGNSLYNDDYLRYFYVGNKDYLKSDLKKTNSKYNNLSSLLDFYESFKKSNINNLYSKIINKKYSTRSLEENKLYEKVHLLHNILYSFYNLDRNPDKITLTPSFINLLLTKNNGKYNFMRNTKIKNISQNLVKFFSINKEIIKKTENNLTFTKNFQQMEFNVEEINTHLISLFSNRYEDELKLSEKSYIDKLIGIEDSCSDYLDNFWCYHIIKNIEQSINKSGSFKDKYLKDDIIKYKELLLGNDELSPDYIFHNKQNMLTMSYSISRLFDLEDEKRNTINSDSQLSIIQSLSLINIIRYMPLKIMENKDNWITFKNNLLIPNINNFKILSLNENIFIKDLISNIFGEAEQTENNLFNNFSNTLKTIKYTGELKNIFKLNQYYIKDTSISNKLINKVEKATIKVNFAFVKENYNLETEEISGKIQIKKTILNSIFNLIEKKGENTYTIHKIQSNIVYDDNLKIYKFSYNLDKKFLNKNLNLRFMLHEFTKPEINFYTDEYTSEYIISDDLENKVWMIPEDGELYQYPKSILENSNQNIVNTINFSNYSKFGNNLLTSKNPTLILETNNEKKCIKTGLGCQIFNLTDILVHNNDKNSISMISEIEEDNVSDFKQDNGTYNYLTQISDFKEIDYSFYNLLSQSISYKTQVLIEEGNINKLYLLKQQNESNNDYNFFIVEFINLSGELNIKYISFENNNQDENDEIGEYVLDTITVNENQELNIIEDSITKFFIIDCDFDLLMYNNDSDYFIYTGETNTGLIDITDSLPHNSIIDLDNYNFKDVMLSNNLLIPYKMRLADKNHDDKLDLTEFLSYKLGTKDQFNTLDTDNDQYITINEYINGLNPTIFIIRNKAYQSTLLKQIKVNKEQLNSNTNFKRQILLYVDSDQLYWIIEINKFSSKSCIDSNNNNTLINEKISFKFTSIDYCQFVTEKIEEPKEDVNNNELGNYTKSFILNCGDGFNLDKNKKYRAGVYDFSNTDNIYHIRLNSDSMTSNNSSNILEVNGGIRFKMLDWNLNKEEYSAQPDEGLQKILISNTMIGKTILVFVPFNFQDKKNTMIPDYPRYILFISKIDGMKIEFKYINYENRFELAKIGNISKQNIIIGDEEWEDVSLYPKYYNYDTTEQKRILSGYIYDKNYIGIPDIFYNNDIMKYKLDNTIGKKPIYISLFKTLTIDNNFNHYLRFEINGYFLNQINEFKIHIEQLEIGSKDNYQRLFYIKNLEKISINNVEYITNYTKPIIDGQFKNNYINNTSIDVYNSEQIIILLELDNTLFDKGGQFYNLTNPQQLLINTKITFQRLIPKYDKTLLPIVSKVINKIDNLKFSKFQTNTNQFNNGLLISQMINNNSFDPNMKYKIDFNKINNINRFYLEIKSEEIITSDTYTPQFQILYKSNTNQFIIPPETLKYNNEYTFTIYYEVENNKKEKILLFGYTFDIITKKLGGNSDNTVITMSSKAQDMLYLNSGNRSLFKKTNNMSQSNNNIKLITLKEINNNLLIDTNNPNEQGELKFNLSENVNKLYKFTYLHYILYVEEKIDSVNIIDTIGNINNYLYTDSRINYNSQEGTLIYIDGNLYEIDNTELNYKLNNTPQRSTDSIRNKEEFNEDIDDETLESDEYINSYVYELDKLINVTYENDLIMFNNNHPTHDTQPLYIEKNKKYEFIFDDNIKNKNLNISVCAYRIDYPLIWNKSNIDNTKYWIFTTFNRFSKQHWNNKWISFTNTNDGILYGSVDNVNINNVDTQSDITWNITCNVKDNKLEIIDLDNTDTLTYTIGGEVKDIQYGYLSDISGNTYGSVNKLNLDYSSSTIYIVTEYSQAVNLWEKLKQNNSNFYYPLLKPLIDVELSSDSDNFNNKYIEYNPNIEINSDKISFEVDSSCPQILFFRINNSDIEEELIEINIGPIIYDIYIGEKDTQNSDIPLLENELFDTDGNLIPSFYFKDTKGSSLIRRNNLIENIDLELFIGWNYEFKLNKLDNNTDEYNYKQNEFNILLNEDYIELVKENPIIDLRTYNSEILNNSNILTESFTISRPPYRNNSQEKYTIFSLEESNDINDNNYIVLKDNLILDKFIKIKKFNSDKYRDDVKNNNLSENIEDYILKYGYDNIAIQFDIENLNFNKENDMTFIHIKNIIIIKKVNHDLEITLFTDSNKTIKITDIFILEKPNYTINFNYNNNTTFTQIKIDNEIKYYKYNFSFGRLNYNFVSVSENYDIFNPRGLNEIIIGAEYKYSLDDLNFGFYNYLNGTISNINVSTSDLYEQETIIFNPNNLFHENREVFYYGKKAESENKFTYGGNIKLSSYIYDKELNNDKTYGDENNSLSKVNSKTEREFDNDEDDTGKISISILWEKDLNNKTIFYINSNNTKIDSKINILYDNYNINLDINQIYDEDDDNIQIKWEVDTINYLLLDKKPILHTLHDNISNLHDTNFIDYNLDNLPDIKLENNTLYFLNYDELLLLSYGNNYKQTLLQPKRIENEFILDKNTTNYELMMNYNNNKYLANIEILSTQYLFIIEDLDLENYSVFITDDIEIYNLNNYNTNINLKGDIYKLKIIGNKEEIINPKVYFKDSNNNDFTILNNTNIILERTNNFSYGTCFDITQKVNLNISKYVKNPEIGNNYIIKTISDNDNSIIFSPGNNFLSKFKLQLELRNEIIEVNNYLTDFYDKYHGIDYIDFYGDTYTLDISLITSIKQEFNDLKIDDENIKDDLENINNKIFDVIYGYYNDNDEFVWGLYDIDYIPSIDETGTSIIDKFQTFIEDKINNDMITIVNSYIFDLETSSDNSTRYQLKFNYLGINNINDVSIEVLKNITINKDDHSEIYKLLLGQYDKTNNLLNLLNYWSIIDTSIPQTHISRFDLINKTIDLSNLTEDLSFFIHNIINNTYYKYNLTISEKSIKSINSINEINNLIVDSSEQYNVVDSYYLNDFKTFITVFYNGYIQVSTINNLVHENIKILNSTSGFVNGTLLLNINNSTFLYIYGKDGINKFNIDFDTDSKVLITNVYSNQEEYTKLIPYDNNKKLISLYKNILTTFDNQLDNDLTEIDTISQDIEIDNVIVNNDKLIYWGLSNNIFIDNKILATLPENSKIIDIIHDSNFTRLVIRLDNNHVMIIDPQNNTTQNILYTLINDGDVCNGIKIFDNELYIFYDSGNIKILDYLNSYPTLETLNITTLSITNIIKFKNKDRLLITTLNGNIIYYDINNKFIGVLTELNTTINIDSDINILDDLILSISTLYKTILIKIDNGEIIDSFDYVNYINDLMYSRHNIIIDNDNYIVSSYYNNILSFHKLDINNNLNITRVNDIEYIPDYLLNTNNIDDNSNQNLITNLNLKFIPIDTEFLNNTIIPYNLNLDQFKPGPIANLNHQLFDLKSVSNFSSLNQPEGVILTKQGTLYLTENINTNLNYLNIEVSSENDNYISKNQIIEIIKLTYLPLKENSIFYTKFNNTITHETWREISHENKDVITLDNNIKNSYIFNNYLREIILYGKSNLNGNLTLLPLSVNEIKQLDNPNTNPYNYYLIDSGIKILSDTQFISNDNQCKLTIIIIPTSNFIDNNRHLNIRIYIKDLHENIIAVSGTELYSNTNYDNNKIFIWTDESLKRMRWDINIPRGGNYKLVVENFDQTWNEGWQIYEEGEFKFFIDNEEIIPVWQNPILRKNIKNYNNIIDGTDITGKIVSIDNDTNSAIVEVRNRGTVDSPGWNNEGFDYLYIKDYYGTRISDYSYSIVTSHMFDQTTGIDLVGRLISKSADFKTIVFSVKNIGTEDSEGWNGYEYCKLRNTSDSTEGDLLYSNPSTEPNSFNYTVDDNSEGIAPFSENGYITFTALKAGEERIITVVLNEDNINISQLELTFLIDYDNDVNESNENNNKLVILSKQDDPTYIAINSLPRLSNSIIKLNFSENINIYDLEFYTSLGITQTDEYNDTFYFDEYNNNIHSYYGIVEDINCNKVDVTLSLDKNKLGDQSMIIQNCLANYKSISIFNFNKYLNIWEKVSKNNLSILNDSILNIPAKVHNINKLTLGVEKKIILDKYTFEYYEIFEKLTNLKLNTLDENYIFTLSDPQSIQTNELINNKSINDNFFFEIKNCCELYLNLNNCNNNDTFYKNINRTTTYILNISARKDFYILNIEIPIVIKRLQYKLATTLSIIFLPDKWPGEISWELTSNDNGANIIESNEKVLHFDTEEVITYPHPLTPNEPVGFNVSSDETLYSSSLDSDDTKDRLNIWSLTLGYGYKYQLRLKDSFGDGVAKPGYLSVLLNNKYVHDTQGNITDPSLKLYNNITIDLDCETDYSREVLIDITTNDKKKAIEKYTELKEIIKSLQLKNSKTDNDIIKLSFYKKLSNDLLILYINNCLKLLKELT